MKFSSLRLPSIVLIALTILMTSCAPSKRTAEVIYRDKGSSNNGVIHLPVESSVEESDLSSSRPDVKIPSEQVIIGLIVPLTGPQAKIGAQLRDAALMALYDTLESAPRLGAEATPRLVIKDGGGNKEKSKTAAEELIAEGARVILGPLVADNVSAAGQVAQNSAVPLIAFSNNEKIADEGVYIFGFVPSQQSKRIASFAASQEIKNYSAISTQDEYGRMVVRDFSKQLAMHGYSVQPVEFYQSGMVPPAALLNNIAKDAVSIGGERKAVFLPITGKVLSAVSLRLMQDIKANNGFLKLLGTGLWDNPRTLQDPGMKGAWFATTSPDLSYDYNTNFFEQYGYAPSRVASLAYDAVALIASNGIRVGASAINNDFLTRRNGFNTVANGGVRFQRNGLVDRALAVVEVGDHGFSIIDSASF